MKFPPQAAASWREANLGMAKVAVATLGFALWHSLLCSRTAKDAARRVVGERRGRALYRTFFMAQSAVTTGALFLFILRQPHRKLYEARGWAKWLGWLGQATSIAVALTAFRDLDQAKFIGIKGVRSLDEGNVIEAEAQGPEVEEDGSIEPRGVFRFSRHPMEWAPVALLLSSPVMRTNWLPFDLLAAAYSYFGAVQEEKRLLKKSPAYAKYQQQVPFFFGRPKKAP